MSTLRLAGIEAMNEQSTYWDGWWRRRTSRRNLLRGAGGLGAAALLAACAPTQTPSAPTGGAAPAPAPTDGVPQIFRYAVGQPPVTLDPNLTAGSQSIFYALWDALTRVDQNANVLPGLAESWKPVDDV